VWLNWIAYKTAWEIRIVDRMRQRRRQLVREAEGYLELGMYQHALDALDRVGDPAELDARAAYLRGEVLRSLERYQEALAELNRAADAALEDIHVWLAMAWCYKRVGRIDLAIQSLESAHEVEPDDALIHYNLACYWSLAGNKGKAIAYLSTAFDIDSEYRDLVDEEPDFDPIRSDPDFLFVTSVIV
jgi:tetratricopeptide (TPR) repeat protein